MPLLCSTYVGIYSNKLLKNQVLLIRLKQNRCMQKIKKVGEKKSGWHFRHKQLLESSWATDPSSLRRCHDLDGDLNRSRCIIITRLNSHASAQLNLAESLVNQSQLHSRISKTEKLTFPVADYIKCQIT